MSGNEQVDADKKVLPLLAHTTELSLFINFLAEAKHVAPGSACLTLSTTPDGKLRACYSTGAGVLHTAEGDSCVGALRRLNYLIGGGEFRRTARWLRRQSGLPYEDCLAAIRAAEGDAGKALQALRDASRTPRAVDGLEEGR